MRFPLQAVASFLLLDISEFGSDIGWVVGHSYIAYSQLLAGATTVLFEGKPVGTPNAGTLWRLTEQHNIKSLFAAPTALRAIRKEDPYGELILNYDISCLKNFFLAGERCDPNTMEWICDLLNEELEYDTIVTDHWWQTETGWPITGILYILYIYIRNILYIWYIFRCYVG